MTKLVMYLKLAGVALAGLLAYFLVARQGRSKALDKKVRNLQHRQRIYRETDADTARQEAALEVKIAAIDAELARERPGPGSADAIGQG